jgi:ribulose-phosphate 3-epimerase
MSRFISPSILAADFNNLGKEASIINKSNASWFHCDVMDGIFVPNISFGFPVIESLKKVVEKPLDVHIMIVEPEKYIDRFCGLGIDILSIHAEACKNLGAAIKQIKDNGVKAGIALNPATPVDILSDVITELDLVLILCVNPGFGGQKFFESTYEKLTQLTKLISSSNSHALIEVDGGVDLSNARKLFDHGADILVAGTSVFRTPDPAKAIDGLLAV